MFFALRFVGLFNYNLCACRVPCRRAGLPDKGGNGMNVGRFFIYLAVMAGVTYLIRVIPLAAFNKKIESRAIRSFLYYVPYAVLAAMTIPDIFYSTSSVYSALAGLVVAVILALFNKGLLTVALLSCVAVFITERLI